MHPQAVILTGPTAIGKTDLAIQLVQHHNLAFEIISVDSAMVYRGMDIGTGKPTAEQLKFAPHHLIDIKNPDEPYSAAEFSAEALQLMNDITARQRIPLLVGGTLLYFKALQNGLSPLPSANAKLRAQLLEKANAIGWQTMHDYLGNIDPVSALRIHPNDPQRIQRAIEVYELTGQPMSDLFHSSNKFSANEFSGESNKFSVASAANYHIHTIALLPSDRTELHTRIEKRFDQMLALGFIEEVEKLYHALCNNFNELGTIDLETPRRLPSLRAVGYRQVLDYLENKYHYAEMREKAIAATRQLAKRQLTWLRSMNTAPFVHCFNLELNSLGNPDIQENLIMKVLEKLELR